jgi:hypothetical protein
MGRERDPFTFMRIIEELLERKISGYDLEKRD